MSISEPRPPGIAAESSWLTPIELVSLGAICYQNEPLLSLAIHDEGELVLPFPG